jgi:hypothetical protein
VIKKDMLGAAPASKHDPEKWRPVFGKDHAQTKALASPLSTGVRPLTHRQICIGGRVNTFALKNPMDQDAEHPIWYCGSRAAPYVAVNEAERAASRRFGRDSFQTRSTP